MIYARANVENPQSIRKVLAKFKALSGQQINVDKSVVVFNKCLLTHVRRCVTNVLNIKEVVSHDKYLGLPTVFLRSKEFFFANLRDRIWKNLQGWKEKLLSKAGKEVLIRAVAYSIPTYAMSCFRIPANFCNEVMNIIRNFLWGTSSSDSGIPWRAWRKVCKLSACKTVLEAS